jgi:copper chaperone
MSIFNETKGGYDMEKITLSVPDISCSHCERAIKGAVEPLPGVSKVIVDIGAKKVQVEYDSSAVTLENVKNAIIDQGYTIA